MLYHKSTYMNKRKFQHRIALEHDAIVKQRGRMQQICDELDELLDKQEDDKTRVLLNAVQGCIDFLRDAERELYID